MSKPLVERAPEFKLENFDLSKALPFMAQYAEVDSQGRYLHWSQLKWRVPRNDAKTIWSVIKFKRHLKAVLLPLKDESGAHFSYVVPHSMEAKLHQVIKIAGGSMGAVAGNRASDSIQQRYLVSSLIMEEAITGAQLEGAATTREVAKKMLEEEREPVDPDERMILNNFLLLKYAERIKKQDLSIDLILEFHRIATQHTSENNVTPGEFRTSNDIYVEDEKGDIAHKPPCYTKLQERLQQLCDFANADHNGLAGGLFIPPVIKAVILHFMLGYEHPFRDGNGRTARALFYWWMLKNEYDLFKYVSISKLLKDDPRGYGLSFLYTEKDQNDLTYFIDFQLDIILQAFADLQEYLQHKTQEFHRVVALLEGSRFSGLNFIQKDLLKKGTKEPGRVFTVKEIASTYEVAENTARKYLNQLAEYKLFLPTKDGRTFIYLAPADLKQRLHSAK